MEDDEDDEDGEDYAGALCWQDPAGRDWHFDGEMQCWVLYGDDGEWEERWYPGYDGGTSLPDEADFDGLEYGA